MTEITLSAASCQEELKVTGEINTSNNLTGEIAVYPGNIKTSLCVHRMKKTFEEWVEIYEKKSGDKHYCPQGFTTLYDPEKGYAQYKVNADLSRLFVYEACGDGRYWYDKGVEICRDNNIPYMVTICTRHIMPYLRLLRFKIETKIVQPERHNGYKIEGVNHLGKRFFCWPAWWDEEKQCNAYYVVSEVTK